MSFIVTRDGATEPAGTPDWIAPEALETVEGGALALALPNDREVDDLAAAFERIAVIRIDFPAMGDGRGFSQARRLRALGYTGRLRAAGQAGLPQVIVPSCVDFMVCGPLTDLPAKWQGRPTYFHNPEFTLVRASRDEQLQAARTIAERLNAATGPVAVLVPTGGLSVPNCARDPDGRPGPFWAPDIDAEFRRVLKAALNPAIAYRESDHHINDNAFARIVLDAAQDLFDL